MRPAAGMVGDRLPSILAKLRRHLSLDSLSHYPLAHRFSYTPDASLPGVDGGKEPYQRWATDF